MKLNLTVSWEVEDESDEAKEALESIVSEESRTFVQAIHRRFADAGVTDIEVNLREAS